MSKEEKVFVRYTNKSLTFHEDCKVVNKIYPWLKARNGKEVEWGYVSGIRVGVYLTPEDAIAFRLIFGNDLHR